MKVQTKLQDLLLDFIDVKCKSCVNKYLERLKYLEDLTLGENASLYNLKGYRKRKILKILCLVKSNVHFELANLS